MSAINISQDNFEQEILKSEQKVLLDFWAPWCGPCRMVAPIVEQIAQERPDIKVGKINVDEEQELAARYSVFSIPTLMIMEKGEILKKSVGSVGRDEILEML